MLKAHVSLPASYSPTIMPLSFSLFLQLAVMQKMHMTSSLLSSMPHFPLMPIGSSQPWNPTLPRSMASTHPKNIASATLYTACPTPADYSTSTTKQHSSLNATPYPLLITVYSIVLLQQKQRTSSSTSTTHLSSPTLQPILKRPSLVLATITR